MVSSTLTSASQAPQPPALTTRIFMAWPKHLSISSLSRLMRISVFLPSTSPSLSVAPILKVFENEIAPWSQAFSHSPQKCSVPSLVSAHSERYARKSPASGRLFRIRRMHCRRRDRAEEAPHSEAKAQGLPREKDWFCTLGANARSKLSSWRIPHKSKPQ